MIDPAKVLAGLPAGLRDPLIETYREIATNFLERRWEPSELNGGKFCEIAYCVVSGAVSGTFPPSPIKPPNMADACRGLEKVPSSTARIGDRSLRLLIPRILVPLYEIRNNRGVGHIGGDVDPNLLDASAVLAMTSWILAELVRIFHNVSTDEAQASVHALVERKHPLVWQLGSVKRILDSSMKAKPQTLLLLYQSISWVRVDDLVSWTEYSNPSVFRSTVLGGLHSKRLVEYEKAADRAHISPLGVVEVEAKILKSRLP